MKSISQADRCPLHLLLPRKKAPSTSEKLSQQDKRICSGRAQEIGPTKLKHVPSDQTYHRSVGQKPSWRWPIISLQGEANCGKRAQGIALMALLILLIDLLPGPFDLASDKKLTLQFTLKCKDETWGMAKGLHMK